MSDSNPYYHGSEEWHAYQSGISDTLARIATGCDCSEINEDHLIMLGEAYIAGVRSVRAGQGGS